MLCDACGARCRTTGPKRDRSMGVVIGGVNLCASCREEVAKLVLYRPQEETTAMAYAAWTKLKREEG